METLSVFYIHFLNFLFQKYPKKFNFFVLKFFIKNQNFEAGLKLEKIEKKLGYSGIKNEFLL